MRELPFESWGRFYPSLPAVFPHSLFSLVFSDREPGLGYAPRTVATFRVRDIPSAGSRLYSLFLAHGSAAKTLISHPHNTASYAG